MASERDGAGAHPRRGGREWRFCPQHREAAGVLSSSSSISVIVVIVAGIKILPKLGYSPWFALLVLIPLVGWVMILVFAFSDWPVDKELRHYRQGGYGPRPGGYPEPPWPGQPAPGYGPGGSQFPQGGWPPPAPNAPPQWPGSSAPSGSAGPPGTWPGGPPEPGDTPLPPWPGGPVPPAPGR